MHCTNCGKEIPDNSKFCDKCGSPVAASIFCSNCGTQNRAGAVVCSKCGARMANTPPAAAPAPQYAPPPPQYTAPPPPQYAAPPAAAPAPQYAAPATGVSDKSRTVAGLLCFFLGTLGAHRFYTGHIGTAIAQLVLSIIGYATLYFVVGTIVLAALGIWVLVDLIMILVGKFKDKKGLLLK
jgi:TM2 domain-containing membrane protein YozV